MEKERNYSRFYMLLKQLPSPYGAEALKEQLVGEYTGGRTTSLRDMTEEEYRACCEGMQNLWIDREALRKKRSATLRLMQSLGIDTGDWSRINDFCRHPRIAGKPFGALGTEELDCLNKKLRALWRKGWRRQSAGRENSAPEPHDKGGHKNVAHLILMQLGTIGQS